MENGRAPVWKPVEKCFVIDREERLQPEQRRKRTEDEPG
jgi:hypothetical protein